MKKSENSHWNFLWGVVIVLILVVMNKCGYKTTQQKAVEHATEKMNQRFEDLQQNSESLQQKINELQKRNEPCNN